MTDPAAKPAAASARPAAASAQPAAAKPGGGAAAKPAPSAAKPATGAKKPAKKKSGCLPKLLLVIIASLTSAAVYYFPKQVESLTGVTLPAFLPSAEKDAAAAQSAPPPSEEQITDSQPAEQSPQTPQTTAEEESPDDVVDTRLRQLQQGADSARAQMREMQAQLTRSEQQIARLAAQLADINHQQGTRKLQLQIIAMQLQLDGNTTAAADALNRLAAAVQDTAAARAMLDEAARLKNIPPRALLLSLLGELRAAAPPDAPAEGGVQAQLMALFNVRHTPTAAPLPLAQEQLRRLELLLLTRREEDYWRLLTQLREDGGGSAEVRDILQRLHEYGAPDYQLTTGGR